MTQPISLIAKKQVNTWPFFGLLARLQHDNRMLRRNILKLLKPMLVAPRRMWHSLQRTLEIPRHIRFIKRIIHS